MTAVRFIRDHDRYMRGEVAGFRPAEAERLVRRKIARFYRVGSEAQLPSRSEQPPEVSDVQAVVELLGTVDADDFDWFAFQREARALVGDNAPRDKAGLIEALEALASRGAGDR